MRRNLRPLDDASPRNTERALNLYSRQSCHLCDDMAQMLAAHGVEVDIIDVDTDPALCDRYGAGVPVLCHGDTEICRYHLDMARLQAHLATLN